MGKLGTTTPAGPRYILSIWLPPLPSGSRRGQGDWPILTRICISWSCIGAHQSRKRASKARDPGDGMDGWMDGSLPVSLPSSSSAPSRLPPQQETRGKLPVASSSARLVGSSFPAKPAPKRSCMEHVVEGEGSGRAGKSGVAIAWSSPHQLPRAPTSRAQAGNIVGFCSVHLQMGGKGGGEGRADVGDGAVVGHWCG